MNKRVPRYFKFASDPYLAARESHALIRPEIVPRGRHCVS